MIRFGIGEVLGLRSLPRALKDVIFPARCLGCGSIFRPTHAPAGVGTPGPARGQGVEPCGRQRAVAAESDGPGSWVHGSFEQLLAPLLCAACLDGYIPVKSPVCPVCGVMFKSRSGPDHLCGDCIRSTRPYKMARSCGVYDGPLRTVIHRLKYGGKTQLARPLGRLLLVTFVKGWAGRGVDCVVPVPLHPSRFRARGFNQVYLLIRQWQPDLASQVSGAVGVRVLPHVLVRCRRTPSQTGLGRQGRRENVHRAFRLAPGADVADQRVLLVDDVFTTGATVEACTAVLLEGGARSVHVLTLARAG